VKTCIYPLSTILDKKFLENTLNSSQDSNTNQGKAIVERQPEQIFFSKPPQKSSTNPSQRNFSNRKQTTSNNNLTNTEEPLHEIVLQINSVKYIFEYYLSHDITYASEELADNFCVAKGKELIVKYLQEKNVTNEQEVNIALYEKCYVPLQNALMTRITEENQKISFNGRSSTSSV
jgi:hypothetical protein